MPRLGSRSLGRRKGRSAAFFRKALRAARKTKRGQQRALRSSFSSFGGTGARAAQLAASTRAWESKRDMNRAAADRLAGWASAQKFTGGIDRAMTEKMFNVAQRELKFLDALKDIRAEFNNVRAGIVQDFGALNRNIRQGVANAGNQFNAAGAAQFADAMAAQQNIAARQAELARQLQEAIANGRADLQRDLEAQQRQAAREAEEARQALQAQMQGAFDNLRAQADAAAKALQFAVDAFAKIPADLNALAGVIPAILAGLPPLPKAIYDPAKKQYLYYCKACNGILRAGSGCNSEQQNKFYDPHYVKIVVIPDPTALENCLKAKYPMWEAVPGPYFNGIRQPTVVPGAAHGYFENLPAFKLQIKAGQCCPNEADPHNPAAPKVSELMAYMIPGYLKFMENLTAEIVKSCVGEWLKWLKAQVLGAAPAAAGAAAGAAGGAGAAP